MTNDKSTACNQTKEVAAITGPRVTLRLKVEWLGGPHGNVGFKDLEVVKTW